jgi:DNA helicase-2/ATP-dependent DNA helicase PcrA
MTPDPILDFLNPQQRAAVTAPPFEPLLIIAGAGTGKTRVITHRLAHLVRDHGVQPWRILATTFTNKAAEEMRRRVGELTAGMCQPDFHIATFHSHCARILRREADAAGLDRSFTIADESDQLRAVKAAMERTGYTDKDLKPAEARHVINQCKMRMLGPSEVSEYRDTPLTEDYSAIFKAYETILQESGAIDFEDILLRCVRLFQTAPSIRENYQQRYRHIMVDEYQDTNLVQVELVDLLAGHHRGLTVVGDEDQCIYSWRGADITNLIEFQKRFPEARLVRLEENYRSTGNILRAAGAVISHNTERLGKTLFTSGGDGPPVWIMDAQDEHEECRGILHSIEEFASRRHKYSYGDMAIFYRVSALSRNIEDQLRLGGIPYRVIGGVRFYDRMEIKDLLAYLQVATNPSNQLSLSRIINTPKRGIGGKTVEALLRAGATLGVSPFHLMMEGHPNLELSKGARAKLQQLALQIEGWNAMTRLASPGQVLDAILEETRYIESLGDPMNPETKARIENIGELKSALVDFEMQQPDASLVDYLEQVSLMNPADESPDDGQSVSLMTIHAAKGLEYKVVFVMGNEQGLFPNLRAYTERGDLEEERRLFYVAITRARHHLILSRTRVRLLYGQPRWNEPSNFLCELPEEVAEGLDPWNPYFPAYESGEYGPSSRSSAGADDGPLVEPEILHDGNSWTSQPASGGQISHSSGTQPTADADDWLPADPVPAPSRPVSGPGPSSPGRAPSALSQLPLKAKGVGSQAGGLDLGSRVRHPLLGTGTITGVSGSHKDQRILVRFDDGTTSQLLARFAGLTPLDTP